MEARIEIAVKVFQDDRSTAEAEGVLPLSETENRSLLHAFAAGLINRALDELEN